MAGQGSRFPVDTKARERAAEKQFIDYTKLQAEYEMIHASHRFIDQFSKNPFAGTKTMEYTPHRLPGHVADGSLSPGTKLDLAPQMASVNQVATMAEAGHANDNSDGAIKPMDDQVTEVAASSAASSRSGSPVKITTKKASFKFNPLAKEFVPDPSLIVTPYGIIPKEKPLLPHEQATFHPYDERMSEGYRAYGDIIREEFHNRNTNRSRWY